MKVYLYCEDKSIMPILTKLRPIKAAIHKEEHVAYIHSTSHIAQRFTLHIKHEDDEKLNTQGICQIFSSKLKFAISDENEELSTYMCNINDISYRSDGCMIMDTFIIKTSDILSLDGIEPWYNSES